MVEVPDDNNWQRMGPCMFVFPQEEVFGEGSQHFEFFIRGKVDRTDDVRFEPSKTAT